MVVDGWLVEMGVNGRELAMEMKMEGGRVGDDGVGGDRQRRWSHRGWSSAAVGLLMVI